MIENDVRCNRSLRALTLTGRSSCCLFGNRMQTRRSWCGLMVTGASAITHLLISLRPPTDWLKGVQYSFCVIWHVTTPDSYISHKKKIESFLAQPLTQFLDLFFFPNLFSPLCEQKTDTKPSSMMHLFKNQIQLMPTVLCSEKARIWHILLNSWWFFWHKKTHKFSAF